MLKIIAKKLKDYKINYTSTQEELSRAKELLYIKERGKDQLNALDIDAIAQFPADKFKQAKELL